MKTTWCHPEQGASVNELINNFPEYSAILRPLAERYGYHTKGGIALMEGKKSDIDWQRLKSDVFECHLKTNYIKKIENTTV